MSQLQVTGEAKIRDIQGPVVANDGVITALDGAASQYVRGDGTLADFPTSSGGGSSVSYYLNSSVSQGTIGGVAYRELSKEPIIGAGTDIAISTTGYVASYLTDANDPDVLSIPGGNFNCEFYFSVSNDTGNPFFYAELYKYDGTTFTLLGSSVGVPEYINQGTIIAPYYFAIPVATAALALTDRLAIRIYVNVDGRTVTLHTENGHLCQVVTTLSKGMVSLNNLTDQSQFLAVGTSGTDFNIVSSGDTHTFNIPSASASNRGLITTGSQTIAGIKTLSVPSQFEQGLYLKQNMNLFQAGYIGLGASTTGLIVGLSGGGFGTLNFNNTTSFTYTFPDATGTIALTSNLSSYVPYTGATTNVDLGVRNLSSFGINVNGDGTGGGALNLKMYNSLTLAGVGYLSIYAQTDYYFGLAWNFVSGTKQAIFNNVLIPINNTRYYNLPNADGTLALTSDLSAYLPLAGGTLTGALSGTTASFSGTVSSIVTSGGTSFRVVNSVNSRAWSLVPSTNGAESDLWLYYGGTGTGTKVSFVNNGNVGINTTNPTYTLDVDGTGRFTGALTASSLIKNGGTSSQYLMADGSTSTLTNPVTGTGTTNYLPKFTGASTIGNSLVYDDGTRVFINATTAPALGSPKFFVKMATANSYEGILVASSSNNNVIAIAHTGSIGLITTNYGTGGTNTNLGFGTGGATQMTLDTSGNLGLGVTPSAWFTSAKVIQVLGAALEGRTTVTQLWCNGYVDAGASGNFYQYTGFASKYTQVNSEHQWFTAPSGTAGNAITFTQAMTLDANNNFYLGGTTNPYSAARMVIEHTSTYNRTMFKRGVNFVEITPSGVYGSINVITSNYTAEGSSYSPLALSARQNQNDLYLSTSGNILIGTTTDAGYKLDVSGTSRFAASYTASGSVAIQTWQRVGGAVSADMTYNDANTSMNFGTSTSHTLNIKTNNTTALSIASTGAATFSSSVTATGNISGNITKSGSGVENVNFLQFRLFGTNAIGDSLDIKFLNNGGNNIANISAILGGDNVAYGSLAFSIRNYNTDTVVEAMRINNRGNVGIGTASPGAALDVNGNATLVANFNYSANGTYVRWQNNGTSFGDIGSAAQLVTGGATNDFAIHARSTYNMVFATNFTERMRITSGGEVLINTTTNSQTSSAGSKFVSNGRLYTVSSLNDNTQESFSMYSTGSSAYRFYVGWGGTVYATNTTISAISDIRFKENIQDIDLGLDAILALKPRKFDWKEGKGKNIKNDRGFIAQEFEQIFPDLIDEWKDPSPEGEEPYKSVRQDLIPILVKAIQELKAEIEELKTKIK